MLLPQPSINPTFAYLLTNTPQILTTPLLNPLLPFTMKKLILFSIVLLSLAFPKATIQATGSSTYFHFTKHSDCGTYKGHSLNRGPKGGCYYVNKNGNKTYVDRSLCKC